MPDDSYDILRRAMLQALGARPAPERRRQIAADLRALAEQQERMAAATETDQASRATPSAPEAQRRPAGTYIRIGREQDPHTAAVRLRVSFGRQIWADFGAPERIEVQRVGAEIWIVPAAGGTGYPISTDAYLPNCLLDNSGPLARLAPGRYAVRLHAGAIVVGERLA